MAKADKKSAELYEDKLFSLQGSAYQSRLPFDNMSSQEIKLFPIIARNPNYKIIFLHIRNRILQMWLKDPQEQLTYIRVLDKIEDIFKEDLNLIKAIYVYLERYGFINTGVFKITRQKLVRRPARVIVIGAGIAGLISARHLQYLGMEVIVLEARERVGGRISTYYGDICMAELGPMLISGVYGNPLNVLVRQNVVDLTPFYWKFKLYDSDGCAVNEERANALKQHYHNLCNLVLSVQDQNEEDGAAVSDTSLEEAFNFFLNMQTHSSKISFLKYLKQFRDSQKLVKAKQLEMSGLFKERHECKALHEELNYKIEQEKQADMLLDIALKLEDQKMQTKLDNLTEKYIELKLGTDCLERDLREIDKDEIYTQSVKTFEKELMDWYLADIETVHGTNLRNISLKHLCDKKDCHFIGPENMVRNGMSILPLTLSQGLDVCQNTRVQSINYDANGVEVICDNTNIKQKYKKMSLAADYVVCTLPLGVLKDVVKHADKEQKEHIVKFDPPLPSSKQIAIKRMGVGLVNKIVLVFDHIFWDTNYNAFGNICAVSQYRSEFYMFYWLTKSPVLVTILSGELAWQSEVFDDNEMKNRCLFLLKQMFGKNVPDPKETVVTRWGSDPYSRGSTSFASPKTLTSDYATLAEPLTAGDSIKIPRVFFAGEHTSRHYAGMVHGAYLSGLQAAGRLADCHLGAAECENVKIATDTLNAILALKTDYSYLNSRAFYE